MLAVAPSHASALREMKDKIDELPLLPQVLVKILQLSPAADDYFEKFEMLVKEDPTFAVRVIALANSSASAPVSPIATIREAIARMGAGTISALVASLAVQKVFMPTEPGQIRLWTHSVFVAVAAEYIAKLVPQLKVDAGQAYLAGLLHDIGRFVMLEHATPELRAVDESHWSSPEELIAADVDVYKFTHSELGYLACKHWGLPENLSNVIRDHHVDFKGKIEPGSVDATNYCVQVADRLSMFVLEDADVVEADERYTKIESSCLIEIAGDHWLQAADLDDSVVGIREAGAGLLSGLGFA